MITQDQIQGHWIRDWIKTPGFEDHTTQVHWMQCGAVYADVRIPLDRPDLKGIASLSHAAPNVLAGLLLAEGFAGTVTLDGDHCTWQRAINWHGEPDGTDIGHIAFDDQGRMIESGVEANYTELWDHEDAPDKLAFQLQGEGCDGTLVVVGDQFVLAIDTPGRPATAPVVAGLKAGHKPADVALQFDCIYATGEWVAGQAHARIATQPKSEGQVILTLDKDRAFWHRTDFHGVETKVVLASTAL